MVFVCKYFAYQESAPYQKCISCTTMNICKPCSVADGLENCFKLHLRRHQYFWNAKVKQWLDIKPCPFYIWYIWDKVPHSKLCDLTIYSSIHWWVKWLERLKEVKDRVNDARRAKVGPNDISGWNDSVGITYLSSWSLCIVGVGKQDPSSRQSRLTAVQLAQTRYSLLPL